MTVTQATQPQRVHNPASIDAAALRAAIAADGKTLERLHGLARLPALQALAVCLTRLDVDALLADGMPPALKQMSFSTGKKKRDEEIRGQLAQLGCARARFCWRACIRASGWPPACAATAPRRS